MGIAKIRSIFVGHKGSGGTLLHDYWAIVLDEGPGFWLLLQIAFHIAIQKNLSPLPADGEHGFVGGCSRRRSWIEHTGVAVFNAIVLLAVARNRGNR